ncbi:MAG: enoyl-CoA hydratase/isomerase family protein [Proteobacteria bacterium]|nr:enoyl-CoA hydratase/isomerase family protein [Pseudomonadota bacterium]MBU4576424.1 enoyl-CoA hydratase/isomerase family protein [Pseudomonadota bacterium]MBU4599103.1 enoyl-CoA hydratase/isomerase family protein [Pseudomonadota bacterium]MBV1714844.1 enoyl-CoA hydratase/isomerase family protein [Desulfarculus sp.]MBV1753124.1 enoyl-CoA hydratase/isomerase family protein [Desulfarculus sp.]
MAEYKTLLIEDRGPVRLITLNQPQIFNPIDYGSGPEIIQALEEAGVDPAVRVLVLTGAGPAFSGGGNVREMAKALKSGEKPSIFFSELAAMLHRSVSALRRLPKPVVCALNGVVSGGGIGWALSCDVVVASDKARFDPGYIRIALSPDGGSTALITRVLGLQRASAFFMLSEAIDAPTAQAWGLVNRVVAPEALMDEALAVAQRLAKGPATALAQTKALLNQAMFGDLETVMENERQSLSRLGDQPDFAEGIAAFFEKRKPEFA